MKGTGGFLHPEKVIDQLELQPGNKVADFGSGAGYFAILIAQKVESEGLVYACDVLPSALEALKSKAKTANILNIKTIRCNLEMPEGSKISTASVDWVICANILFQSQKKPAILQEAKRILKPQAKLIIIDWQPDASFAPKEGWPLDQKQALALVEEQGFTLEKEIDAGQYHWGIILKRQ